MKQLTRREFLTGTVAAPAIAKVAKGAKGAKPVIRKAVESPAADVGAIGRRITGKQSVLHSRRHVRQMTPSGEWRTQTIEVWGPPPVPTEGIASDKELATRMWYPRPRPGRIDSDRVFHMGPGETRRLAAGPSHSPSRSHRKLAVGIGAGLGGLGVVAYRKTAKRTNSERFMQAQRRKTR